MRATTLFLLSVLAGLYGQAGPAAADQEFLQRFEGKWSGSGAVRRNADEGTHNAKCSMTGSQTGQKLDLSGTCRVLALFSRKVGASISYNPGTKVYSGTYTGSVIGPARISGKRRGNAVVLTVTWPKPVNGDTKATMRIENTGNGRFRFLVMDAPSGGGAEVETSNLSFAKSG